MYKYNYVFGYEKKHVKLRKAKAGEERLLRLAIAHKPL